jgi:outer membrane lipoprotein-sorting protein
MNRSPAGARIRPKVLLVALAMVVCLRAYAENDAAEEKLLSTMDETAAKFHSAQANFTWTTFNSVVNEESGRQMGKIYFQRNGNETEMSAIIDPPDAQQVIFSQGKIQLYKSRTDIEDVYDAGNHRDEFETFLVLGFGSSGSEMRKSFDIQYSGQEKIDGTETDRLELIPKSDKIKQHFPKIILWINPQNGISVQQKLMEADGDYRLAKYSNIRLGQKIPAKTFQLKTSGKTKVVTH